MKKSLVSIVINNYNYGRFLGEAINSALSQTYRHIEVIVVDDGSTDESQSVVESFGSKIKAVFKENGGQGSAINAGFVKAAGDLIFFLDSDDILEPEAVEEVFRRWSPAVAKVHFYMRLVGPDGVKAYPSVIPSSTLPQGDLRNEVLGCGSYISPPASGNAYSRTALSQILPMPEFDWQTAADTVPIFLTPLLGEVRSCPKVLARYRVHGGNRDAQTCADAPHLRYRLKKEFDRDRLLTRFCATRNLQYSAGAVTNQFGHFKARFGSLILDSGRHPYREDTRWHLAARLIVLGWTNKAFGIRKRILNVFWTLGMLFAPTFSKQTLCNIGFMPSKRGGFLTKVLNPQIH